MKTHREEPYEAIEQKIASKRQERVFAERLREEAKRLDGDPFCFDLKIAFCKIEEEALMWALQKIQTS